MPSRPHVLLHGAAAGYFVAVFCAAWLPQLMPGNLPHALWATSGTGLRGLCTPLVCAGVVAQLCRGLSLGQAPVAPVLASAGAALLLWAQLPADASSLPLARLLAASAGVSLLLVAQHMRCATPAGSTALSFPGSRARRTHPARCRSA